LIFNFPQFTVFRSSAFFRGCDRIPTLTGKSLQQTEEALNQINKKELSETDICDLFITPAIKNAGWDAIRQIRREVTLTPGPVIVRGNMSSRNKKKKKFADYILYKEPGVPIAVVEAKDNNCTVSQGMQQALGYAEILQVPSAFSSNGDAFASHNKAPKWRRLKCSCSRRFSPPQDLVTI
jgi:type I site-specific restriction endonuclease